jgi:hypothetical protein
LALETLEGVRLCSLKCLEGEKEAREQPCLEYCVDSASRESKGKAAQPAPTPYDHLFESDMRNGH